MRLWRFVCSSNFPFLRNTLYTTTRVCVTYHRKLTAAYVNSRWMLLKDGAYYYFCAYVLRISRYSGFLWVVPTNTGMFLRGLKLYREKRNQQMLLVSRKKWGVTMHFSTIALILEKNSIHCFIVWRVLEILLLNYL